MLTFSPWISSGHARDFGVEPSSVLLLRVLKKDPVGLERDPAGATCPRSGGEIYHLIYIYIYDDIYIYMM